MKHLAIQGANVPALGLGTYRLTGPEAVKIIAGAIELGYRHLDTAQFYDNEAEVGEAVRVSGLPRDDFFITTKVWPANLHASRFLSSVEESLRLLKMERVDLLLIHWPHASLPLEHYLEPLMQAREMGYTRFVGVSNFNIAQLERSLQFGVPVFTNQVEFHPLLDQRKLLGWMQQRQIPLTAYCPLAQGQAVHHPQVRDLAHRHGKTPAQIILRWMMQLDGVMAIPKSANPRRLAENLAVFDFELSDAEMDRIGALQLENRRMVPAFAGSRWD